MNLSLSEGWVSDDVRGRLFLQLGPLRHQRRHRARASLCLSESGGARSQPATQGVQHTPTVPTAEKARRDVVNEEAEKGAFWEEGKIVFRRQVRTKIGIH